MLLYYVLGLNSCVPLQNHVCTFVKELGKTTKHIIFRVYFDFSFVFSFNVHTSVSGMLYCFGR